MVALDDVVQRQAQNIFIEVARFFSVLGSVSVVVQPKYWGWRWRCKPRVGRS
jgi:hypothetical protein